MPLIRPCCFIISLAILLSACGGGGGNNNASGSVPLGSVAVNSSSSSSTPSASSSSSSVASSTKETSIKLSGSATYDYVPHNANHIGLNYSAIQQKPIRGAVIELLDQTGNVLNSSVTANDGSYSFDVSANQSVKVRIKAQLQHNTIPMWNVMVEDNTDSNALYAMEGELISTGPTSSVRNLHAASGWNGSTYSSARVSAPFAILDAVYTGISRLNAVGNTRNYPLLKMLWSTKNKAAAGDATKGEIDTTYFSIADDSIYILGDADSDTDEFDTHVLLHEWGHYIEDNFFRSDSPGGDHSSGDYLDMRLSMSEGFANAFSGMLQDNPYYADAGGISQSSGFTFDLSKKNYAVKGFYSENSITSIFYNYYISADNKIAKDLSPIFNVFSNSNYYANEAMTSIFLFYAQLKQQLAMQAPVFMNLMHEQNIIGTDEYGQGEINDAGLSISLPVYKLLATDGNTTNVCSSSDFGKYNKLANSQFLKITVTQTGLYAIKVKKASGDNLPSKPEFVLYSKGNSVLYAQNKVDDNVSGNANLSRGTYILEVYDVNNHDADNLDHNTHCFDINVITN